VKSTANRSTARWVRALGLTGGGLALALSGALVPSATAEPGPAQGAGQSAGSWAESAYRGSVDVGSTSRTEPDSRSAGLGRAITRPITAA
jgi:hypothetical protein